MLQFRRERTKERERELLEELEGAESSEGTVNLSYKKIVHKYLDIPIGNVSQFLHLLVAFVLVFMLDVLDGDRDGPG